MELSPGTIDEFFRNTNVKLTIRDAVSEAHGSIGNDIEETISKINSYKKYVEGLYYTDQQRSMAIAYIYQLQNEFAKLFEQYIASMNVLINT